VGFIGSNQINVLLLKKFSSQQIFRATLFVQCPVALLFLAGTLFGVLKLPTTLALLFISLSSLGLAYPNAAALALVPFEPKHRKRVGHARLPPNRRIRACIGNHWHF
jgi:MFS transporter, DHA1 family, multidrug resistance protein